jgi:hypothetical protein
MRFRSYLALAPFAFGVSLRLAMIVVTILLSGPLVAADSEAPPLITDRPDVTESSEVVDRGLVQVEMGYSFFRFEDGSERLDLWALPGTLVRVGLHDRVELRVEWAGYLRESLDVGGSSHEDSGWGNAALGAKIKLRDEKGAAPQLALLVDAVVPSGTKSFRAERVDPAVRLAGSHTLTERLGLGYNFGFGALTIEEASGDIDTLGLGRYSLALGIGLSEHWGTFVEVFGFMPTSGGPAHSVDAGLTYLVSRNLQLDLSGGLGVNDRAEDWFVGAGISFRLPR